MTAPRKNGLRKAAASTYLVWGVMHVGIATALLLTNLFGPADAFESVGIPADTSPHARVLMVQNNISFLVASVVVAATAVAYGWRGFDRGYWVMLGLTTLFTGLVLLELVPGHLPWSQGAWGIPVWLAANVLGTVVHYRRRALAPASPVHGSPQ